VSDTRLLVIGVGNPDRGDDGVGRLVARLLEGMEHDGEGTSLLAAFQGAEHVWLIDAAQSGAPAGTIHHFDCAANEVLPHGGVSSHGFGVAEAIALARALGTLPPLCTVYAIEGGDFTPGAPLSPEVARAAEEVVEHIRGQIASLCDCEERSDEANLVKPMRRQI
jgi:hydrogenase maturation protease